MLPPSWRASILRITMRLTAMVPLRLRSMTVSTSSSEYIASTPSRATPALLMSTSIRPHRADTALTKAVQSSTFDRSAVWKRKRSPVSDEPAQASTSGVDVRAQVATRSPESRYDCTIPAPRPRLPPVTMTTRCCSAGTGVPPGALAARGWPALRRCGCSGAERPVAARRRRCGWLRSPRLDRHPGAATASTATMAPVILFGRPKTRAIWTSGTASTRSSIGSGWTFTPPTLMTSVVRPRNSIRSPTTSTRSPVARHPSGVDRILAVVAEHPDARAHPQLAVDDAHGDVGVVAPLEHGDVEAAAPVAHGAGGADLARRVDVGELAPSGSWRPAARAAGPARPRPRG